MAKTLEQFKIHTLNGRFGNPGTSDSNLGDPAYAGQCVSYVRLYMEEVLGIKTAVWGHAVNYWTNPVVLKYFDKVTTPQDGDIVVWGDDPGNWTSQYGHIAIWYKGRILNQNYGGNLKVTLNEMFTPGLLGYLRPKDKGGNKLMDRETVNYAYRAVMDAEPTPDQLTYWMGRDAKELLMALYKASELRRYKANNYDRDTKKAKPAEQAIKDADRKLAAIKDALGIK